LSLETIIQDIKTELMAKNQIREETHEAMRKTTSLSKQAILLIHQKRLAEDRKSVV
jgi:predicted translin family RNA/ssDNA-binding protein